MKAKDFKVFLEKIPDDTDIIIRCQRHEFSPAGSKEIVEISSVTPLINDTTHIVMLNPERKVRLAAYEPNPMDPVSCMSCVRCKRIVTCKEKGRICDTCTAVCECKKCGHTNIKEDEPFAKRPKYELDTNFVQKNK